MSKTFQELQEMYRGIVKRFNKIELQDWRAEREDEDGYLKSRGV